MKLFLTQIYWDKWDLNMESQHFLPGKDNAKHLVGYNALSLKELFRVKQDHLNKRPFWPTNAPGFRRLATAAVDIFSNLLRKCLNACVQGFNSFNENFDECVLDFFHYFNTGAVSGQAHDANCTAHVDRGLLQAIFLSHTPGLEVLVDRGNGSDWFPLSHQQDDNKKQGLVAVLVNRMLQDISAHSCQPSQAAFCCCASSSPEPANLNNRKRKRLPTFASKTLNSKQRIEASVNKDKLPCGCAVVQNQYHACIHRVVHHKEPRFSMSYEIRPPKDTPSYFLNQRQCRCPQPLTVSSGDLRTSRFYTDKQVQIQIHPLHENEPASVHIHNPPPPPAPAPPASLQR